MLTWLFGRSKSPASLAAADAGLPPELSAFLTNAGVQTYRGALQRVMGEFDRARRHNRSITVALFNRETGSEPAAPAAGGRSTGDPGLLPAMLAALLREATRETDIVVYAAALGRCIVIMPETGADEARDAVSRLHDLVAARLMLPIRVCVAVFPGDGLTLEELIRHADENAAAVVRASRLTAGEGAPSIAGAST